MDVTITLKEEDLRKAVSNYMASTYPVPEEKITEFRIVAGRAGNGNSVVINISDDIQEASKGELETSLDNKTENEDSEGEDTVEEPTSLFETEEETVADISNDIADDSVEELFGT